MLTSILNSGADLKMMLLEMLLMVLALIPPLTFHEWAHGFIAYKLGDYTAKADGRLSLNPFAHFDLLGTISLLLIGFGWAKPVPVNTRNFQNPRRDFALTSLAGPVANFIYGMVAMFLRVLWENIAVAADWPASSAVVICVWAFLQYTSLMSIGLGLFNLIPIPPLDGSNILMCLLPNRAAAKYSRIRYYSQYIILAIVILTWLPYPFSEIPNLLFYPLGIARDWLAQIFAKAAYGLLSLVF